MGRRSRQEGVRMKILDENRNIWNRSKIEMHDSLYRIILVSGFEKFIWPKNDFQIAKNRIWWKTYKNKKSWPFQFFKQAILIWKIGWMKWASCLQQSYGWKRIFKNENLLFVKTFKTWDETWENIYNPFVRQKKLYDCSRRRPGWLFTGGL